MLVGDVFSQHYHAIETTSKAKSEIEAKFDCSSFIQELN